MRMFVGVLVATRLAKEGQEHQAPAVEAGEQRGNNQHPEGITALRARPCAFDHRIFGQEARETNMGQRNTNTGDGQRANHHRPEGFGKFILKTTVIAHVLFVMHAMDH